MIQSTTIQNLEQAKTWLQARLSHERYEHSLGAHDKAVELADKFRLPAEDRERAAVAGLLHDAAKLMSPQDLLAYCDQHGIELDPLDRETPQTLHPYAGADIVRRELGIEDPVILNAIRYHTTGRPDMSAVEKIVYIADKIEGNTRNPLYIQRMTASLDFQKPESLDLTVLFILDSTIQFLIEKHQLIHPRTLEARNDIVSTLRKAKHL